MCLINKLLKQANWNDDFPSNEVWKGFYDDLLRFASNKNILNNFWPRLKSSKKNQRDGAFAEILAAYFIENNLGYQVDGWNVPTANQRDVDFTFTDKNNEKIYCEVKNPGWKGELDRESSPEAKQEANIRSKKEKHQDGEFRSYATWREIRKTIENAYGKYLQDKKNLLILVPDFWVSLFDTCQDLNIRIALFEENGIYNNEMGYFCTDKYRNLGGVLFLEPELKSGSNNVIIKNSSCLNKNASNPINILP